MNSNVCFHSIFSVLLHAHKLLQWHELHLQFISVKQRSRVDVIHCDKDSCQRPGRQHQRHKKIHSSKNSPQNLRGLSEKRYFMSRCGRCDRMISVQIVSFPDPKLVPIPVWNRNQGFKSSRFKGSLIAHAQDYVCGAALHATSRSSQAQTCQMKGIQVHVGEL